MIFNEQTFGKGTSREMDEKGERSERWRGKKNEEEKGIRRWNAKWSPAAEIMQYILPKLFRETR